MYIGVTNDLSRRLYEHKNEQIDGFTKRYHVHRLVYFEEYSEVSDAIAREKQLKHTEKQNFPRLIIFAPSSCCYAPPS